MDRGNRLKILRILSGLSQDGLATYLHSSQGNVATWERKNMFPRDSDIARKLADALQATLGYLAYGESKLDCAFWEPQPPTNPRHFNDYISDISRLFPELCYENNIEVCACYRAENGCLCFLGCQGAPLSFVLLLKADIADCFLSILSKLSFINLEGLEGYPPNHLGSLEEESIDSLAFYYRLAQSYGLNVDTETINTAFLKIKKIRRMNSIDDTKCLVRSAFLHFQIVMQEFNIPTTWKPQVINPRYPTLEEILSLIFERIYEEVEEKSLVWSGELDKDLADMIRCLLKGQGFKEKTSKTLTSK